jgi:Cellulase (glycosyl hydrolase family 5)
MRGRSSYWTVAAGLVLCAVAVTTLQRQHGPDRQPAAAAGPKLARVQAELDRFTDWLATGRGRGYVGEVGWPAGADDENWNALASTWYRQAARAGLEVTYWATGEWWQTDYPLSAYVASRDGRPIDTPRAQAAVVEAQPPTLREITVNGGEFGDVPETQPTSRFSNRTPGAFEQDWHYDQQASFDYLASRGITVVKVPFRWERVQPVLGGPLQPEELARLHAVVARAGRAGLKVILDLHNYGGYYESDGRRGVRRTVGSAALPDSRLADVWRRLSDEFRGDPAVHAYDIMAEPAEMPPVGNRPAARVWEHSAQVTLDAIRANGDRTLVMVPGYDWSALATWTSTHPRPWIADPAGNFRYEAHHYWDDGSGTYAGPSAD